MGREIRNYNGLELIAELVKYAKNKIPEELMKTATSREYSTSRQWRAKDVPDMMFRALSGWYYRWVEFPILKRKLSA